MHRKLRIFGVDPGTRIVGYGVIDLCEGEMEYVGSGAIKGGGSKEPIGKRLGSISRELRTLLQEFKPDVFVVEKAFYGKSIEAAIRLGEGRGAALVCAAEEGIPIAEYPPAVVKKAVVGFGMADKSQVAVMVQNLLRLPEPPTPSDAADALALALCHGHREG